ncbi:hypothetical protein B566_EDAN006710 [Ephemera danica]|nr:hypothetical protein B566_EDAN006710 [Ephemera danica]
MSKRSEKRKRRQNVEDTDEQTDSEIPFVTFVSDADCIELLYVEGQALKASQRRRASSNEIETPKHERVTALLGETPPSRRGRPRMSALKMNIPNTIEEDENNDDESDEWVPIAKPRVLFPETHTGVSPSPKMSSKKNKERMEQKIKASQEKYSSPAKPDGATPTKAIEVDMLTPRARRNKLQTTPTTPRSQSRTGQVSTPKTPKSVSKVVETAKTPRPQRMNIKKNLDKVMNEEGSDESDSSLSESDYSESEFSEPPTPQHSRVNTPKNSRPTTPVSVSSRPGLRTRIQAKKDVYKSDDYFASHGSSKVVTSDKTLSLLQNPRLQAETVQDNLRSVPLKHEKEIEALVKANYDMFDRWMLLLHEGFNLLLHGLGSKASLLNALHENMLTESYDTIVINGFFTSLTIKDILKSIAEDIAGLTSTPADEVDLCDAVVTWFSCPKAEPLYLLLNNLDGAMLQSMFDQAQLSRFNFVWQDVTNFVAYSEETAFENSLLVQQSGGLALASLRSVFQSLTSNAKAIFNIIMSKQLDSTDQKYPGMAFKDLYRESQDAFLVASESALRTHLTEFLDHHLVRVKRGHDGSDMLLIPIPQASLLEFRASQVEQ